MEDRGIKHFQVLFGLITCFLCGAILFLLGFFPVSYHKFEQAGNDYVDYLERPVVLDEFIIKSPPQRYSQTIMMLIDALRNDFPSNVNMPFAYDKACAHFKLRVDIPTVTMPRLKSLTTGTISNFIDIVLNLGQAEQLDDSLLHRLNKRGDIIVFAGDHTWVHLFPNAFRRKEPNFDSFFVQDFYEGDKNITKVLSRELQRSDWSFLILHYLGLDHIGHVEGTESSKISTKLKEMDNVVQKIYNANNLRNQFFLLTGDHGMRNGGGHGGSTVEELYVPLLMFEGNCTKKSLQTGEYNQIDLTPTLSILFSIDIPGTSIGCLIPELLRGYSLEEQLYAYYYNTQHLVRKATTKFGKDVVNKATYFKWFTDAKLTHKLFLKIKRIDKISSAFYFENAKLDYMRASSEISTHLSASLVSFNYDLILIGISLTTLTSIYAPFVLFPSEFRAEIKQHFSKNKLDLIVLAAAVAINIWCHYMCYITTNRRIFSYLVTLPIALCVHFIANICKILLLTQKYLYIKFLRSFPLLLPACFTFHVISLASSSYIEFEHHIWYYLGASILTMFMKKNLYKSVSDRGAGDSTHVLKVIVHEVWKRRMTLLNLIFMPFLRRLDAISALNANDNKYWISLLFALGLIFLLVRLRQLTTTTQLVACIIAALSVYCFRGLNGAVCIFPIKSLNIFHVLYIFWTSTAGIAFLGYKYVIHKFSSYGKKRMKSLYLLKTTIICLHLITALLHKPQNVILLSAMLLALDEAYKLCYNLQINSRCTNTPSYVLYEKTILTIFLAKMFYYYQGNTNSLATIDLNPGYIGQSSFNAVIVGIFVTLNTYCAPINAFMYLVLHVHKINTQCKQSEDEDMQKKLVFTNLMRGTQQNLQLVLSVYTIATLLPVAVYLCLLLSFRHHLFIYSVFAPKVLYECFSVIVLFIKLLIIILILLISRN